MQLNGWVELDGKKLTKEELSDFIRQDPAVVTRLGGEFYLEYDSCKARDHYGIIQGDCPAGVILCDNRETGTVSPACGSLSLADAIKTSVDLRSDSGITALSGGVDSALVAVLAKRPCLVVGMEGCHDIRQAQAVAKYTNLPLHIRTITVPEIEDAISVVAKNLEEPNPVDLAIGTTLYFVAQTAHDLGYERILTGQGADEVFGGYARYLETAPDKLEELFLKDFASLKHQGRRTSICHILISGLYALHMQSRHLTGSVMV